MKVPQFGFKAEHEVEQRTLRRIATLRSERRTPREIAKVLNREGRKPRRADVWSPKQPKLSSLGRMEVAA